ncbi:hypothetical protein K449DRAFT_96291 [Hypoxylon sp. EC38]|nr:hypothetical protein K449DRAFT_96291 [Hypoxylon sp. EC38]
MARGGLSSKEQGYIPHIPSPLNPSNTETPPRRQRRNDYCRATKYGQSPTQRLMRQKAAAAWRSMSSLDNFIMDSTRTGHDEVRANPGEQMEDSYPACSDKEHYTETVRGNQLREVDLNVRESDMEKQALVESDYQEDRLLEAAYLSRITTRRLITTLGIMCILGVLIIIRGISRIQAWQT